MDLISSKPLSFSEACEFLGYKKSYVYKLCHARIIPFSKPNGKKLFFDKQKLKDWMLSNPSRGSNEIQAEAANYVSSN